MLALVGACSSDDGGAATSSTTPGAATSAATSSTTPVSTTPTTVPTGFAADDAVLNWLVHPDTRAARDHLLLIGDRLFDVEAGRDDAEEIEICRSHDPISDDEYAASEEAAVEALAAYPVPDSRAVDLHFAVIALYRDFTEVCASGDLVAAERIEDDLRATAAEINVAFTEDRAVLAEDAG